MKIVQWNMKEKFVFPVEAGIPIGAETVNVTPMFTVNRTDDAVRLNGIYHISANIMLNVEKTRKEIAETVILIDDVEIGEKTGYFEYAVPFNIDLPSEAKDPLHVTAENTLCKVDNEGSFSITWDVDCAYQEGDAVKKEVIDTEKEVIKEKIVKQEISKPEVVKQEPVKKQETPVIEAVAEVKKVEKTPETSAIALLDSTSFNEMDEVLAFIEGLDDGISSTLFRSNDIFV